METEERTKKEKPSEDDICSLCIGNKDMKHSSFSTASRKY